MKTLNFSVSDGLALIELNRPEVLNALSLEMRAELFSLTDRLFYDNDIRVVVFTGAGRAFSAGGDVKQFDEKLLTPIYRAQLRQITKFFDDLEALEKPVIAALNGAATGAGIGLALACDIRIASTEAKLGFREQNIGLISAVGGCSRLVRLVGLGKAKEIIFTGEMLDAQSAQQLGLINRVVEADKLMDEVMAFAKKLMKRAPQALGLAKRVLNAATNTDQTSSLVIESLAQSVLTKTGDHKEGVDAFLEKRNPEFRGE